MLMAVEHLGSVGVGVTVPQFFRADDKKVYVVKLQHNPLGSKVLVNELAAARLGQLMGLRFPVSSIIEINEQTCQNNPRLLLPEISFGRHFASLYLEHTQYVDKHNLAKAMNRAEMAGILLFDHLFHNVDRANNKKNLLLYQEDGGDKLYAIDNSHLFRSGKWTLESLTNLSTKIKIYNRYTFGMLLKDYLSPQDFLPYLKTVLAISDKDIEAIVAEIPVEWLPDHPERQGLASHIKVRLAMAEKICDTLYNYIPKTRGGGCWLCGRTIGVHHKSGSATHRI